ncbi:glycosyltransferase [uncultured Psychrobacter sp.]|uniref:glycosyltransferase n=1 Tax=uncultured Psychrobacter sp. TaxID=259303 RepID=UPI0025959958|nr:glycosyltransferase [uncultured Psychrobacter sp.]
MSLIFVTNGLHRTAGTEKVIVQLANELNREIKVVVPGTTDIAFKGYDNLNIVSLNIGDFPSKGLTKKIYHRLKYLKAIRSIIEDNDTVFAFSFDLNSMLILLSFIRNIHIIASEHIEYSYHKGIRNSIRKILYKNRNVQLVCLTETDRLKFLKDGINVCSIPNFIYPTNHIYNSKNKNILAVGRLEYQKNFSLLIKAFAKSEIYKNGWKLTIVGEGSELTMLNDLVSKMSLDSFVRIQRYTKDINTYYTNAGLFCMTSRFEAFPMVLLEAMNHKLPVLLTDFPTGAKEILGNDNEQIVPNNNIKVFADQLQLICNDSDLRNKLSARNADIIKSYYVNEVIEKWHNFL